MKDLGAKPSTRLLLTRRLAPVLLLAALLLLFFALGLDQHLSFEALRANRQWLTAQVADHAVLSAMAFMAAYVAVTALSLPGAAAMTVAGGFLFGQIVGTLYVLAAATLGATILFLVARTVLGDTLRARSGPWLKRMEAGFADNALSYMLVLRLVPVFPFFIVNLVPAFLGVPLWIYVLGTFLGIIPATFVYASVGAGLGAIFASGAEFSPDRILSGPVLTGLFGLAGLALLPVFLKRVTFLKRVAGLKRVTGRPASRGD